MGLPSNPFCCRIPISSHNCLPSARCKPVFSRRRFNWWRRMSGPVAAISRTSELTGRLRRASSSASITTDSVAFTLRARATLTRNCLTAHFRSATVRCGFYPNGVLAHPAGYQYQSDAELQESLIVRKCRDTLSKGDLEGPAANPYDLRAEWGAAFGDNRVWANFGPTFPVPLKVMINANVIYRSAQAYNITTGLPDPSGDGFAVQRPAFLNLPAASCTSSTQHYVAEFGCFEVAPAAGTPTISRNFARGPSNFNMLLRVSRTWGFVNKTRFPAGCRCRRARLAAPPPSVQLRRSTT